jgi:hypothetical protein
LERVRLASISALAFAVACGAVGAAGCGEAPSAPAPTACADVKLLVVASDYYASAVGGAPGEGRVRLPYSGIKLGNDPALAVSRGRAFFLARDNDTLFELDPGCGTPQTTASVHELAPVDAARGVRGRANPHDVAVAPDGSLFVALYDVPKIAIVAGGALAGAIDLSSYDADGNPQAEAIRIVDVGGAPKAFVALERLDDTDRELPSRQPSTMLRIDVATRAVEAAVELAGRNPFNAMAEQDGALFMAEPGNFDAAGEPKAGIERFDTATSTSRILVPESALGGSVAEIAVDGPCGAAIVAGPVKDVNPTSVVTFDAATGALASRGVLATPGYDLQGLAWRGRTLYVGDRRAGPDGYPVHVLERDDSCMLRESNTTIELSQRPVALRPAL